MVVLANDIDLAQRGFAATVDHFRGATASAAPPEPAPARLEATPDAPTIAATRDEPLPAPKPQRRLPAPTRTRQRRR
jgi:hypothetical protein